MRPLEHEHKRRRDDPTVPVSGTFRVPKLVWLALLATVIVVALAGTTLSYLSGGGRLNDRFGHMFGPTVIGEEYHLVLPVSVEGDLVELRDVDVVATGEATIEVRLIRGTNGAPTGGSHSGPLPYGFEAVPIGGQAIEELGEPGLHEYAIDIRLVAEERGATSIDEVRVTYDAGRFRERTSITRAPLCIWAVTDITDESQRGSRCPEPGVGGPGDDSDR